MQLNCEKSADYFFSLFRVENFDRREKQMIFVVFISFNYLFSIWFYVLFNFLWSIVCNISNYLCIFHNNKKQTETLHKISSSFKFSWQNNFIL